MCRSQTSSRRNERTGTFFILGASEIEGPFTAVHSSRCRAFAQYLLEVISRQDIGFANFQK